MIMKEFMEYLLPFVAGVVTTLLGYYKGYKDGIDKMKGE